MKRFKDVISRLRDGYEAEDWQIEEFVRGVASGIVSDAQIAAYAMAIYLRGMTGSEVVALTKSMGESGTVLNWDDINGVVLDKDSTGGVGDLTSLVLVPILAACGAYVPMVSIRGLGGNNSTVSKLKSIPGYRTSVDEKTFKQVVKEVGCSIVETNKKMNPADQRIRKIRDEASTVESEALIVSSLLSKKIAVGVKNVILDIKVGNGTFLPSYAAAKKLASKLVGVGQACGMKITACITDMNQPLGSSVGHSLEVKEAVEFLTNVSRNTRLYDVVVKLASELLIQHGLAKDIINAEAKVEVVIDSGAAAQKFGQMVAAMGGPEDFMTSYENYLPKATFCKAVYPDKKGHLHTIDAKAYADAVSMLSDRQKTGEVDCAVGLSQIAIVSSEVSPEKALAVIHAKSEEDWNKAATMIRDAASVELMPVSGSQPFLDMVKPL